MKVKRASAASHWHLEGEWLKEIAQRAWENRIAAVKVKGGKKGEATYVWAWWERWCEAQEIEDTTVPCECAMCWAIRSHSSDCASPFLIACQLGFAVMELPLRKRFQFFSCALNFVSTYPCFSCCPFDGHCMPLLSQSKPVLFSWWRGVLPSCTWPCTFGNIFQMWFGIYSFLNWRWKNSNSLIWPHLDHWRVISKSEISR